MYMKVILATGIYPPDIGGPATYVRALADELSRREIDVTVVTYSANNEKLIMKNEKWGVVRVVLGSTPILRWFRYAKALKEVGADADIVYAFSSVSCGVPLMLARLKKPKKILRLGGDFVWERYTAVGGRRSLKEWYEKSFQVFRFAGFQVWKLLRVFDHIVFSTRFQEEIYEKHFRKLPPHSVIENAMSEGASALHVMHEPFRLLFMGRFVGFKNLPSLIRAVKELPNVRLTMVGDGPKRKFSSLPRTGAKRLVRGLLVSDRVMFVDSVSGEEKQKILENHDLLVLPSLTEISPNSALEARACGLPVLLTEETGLSGQLRDGMVIRKLRTPEDIVRAVNEVRGNYQEIAKQASAPVFRRGWGEVAEEHMRLFEAF